MPLIETADRAVASVTATGSDDWQVVSTPTGFRGITSADFSDNDKVAGFCLFENGEDYEVYDTEDDTTSTLLEITNITGTVTISRPATPYKSSNGGDRVAAGSGTHTLVIGMGAGTAKRLLRDTNPTWLTFTSADATPSVAGYRLFKTNGSTAITAFDDMEAGKVFFVKRGNADIVITDNANIDCGGSNLTLTADYPAAVFVEDGGVAILIGGSLRADLASTANAKGASLVGIEDSGSRFTGTEVETALTEVPTSAELASTDNGEGAALIGIEDAAGVYAAANVEAALLEARKNAFIDGGTVAADGNNEITVAPRRKYVLTNGDTIDGVIGLAAGEFAAFVKPATGSATLSNGGTVTAGVDMTLTGGDLIVNQDLDDIIILQHDGTTIRRVGGGSSDKIETPTLAGNAHHVLFNASVAGRLYEAEVVDSDANTVLANVKVWGGATPNIVEFSETVGTLEVNNSSGTDTEIRIQNLSGGSQTYKIIKSERG